MKFVTTKTIKNHGGSRKISLLVTHRQTLQTKVVAVFTLLLKLLIPIAFLCLFIVLALSALPFIKQQINSFNLFELSHETVCLSGNKSICIASDYCTVLVENGELILIEPDLLMGLHSFNWDYLRGRFDLPAGGFGRTDHWLTVGLLLTPEQSLMLVNPNQMEGVSLLEEVTGPVPNYSKSSGGLHLPLHYFLRQDPRLYVNPLHLLLSEPLHLHIVVFHSVEEYLWVGAIPEEVQAKFSHLTAHFHFGAHEQIFDPFTPKKLLLTSADDRLPHHHNSIKVPDDIGHLLSQLPTSRYLHCPPERRDAWFAAANLTANREKEEISLVAYRQMKALSRYLRMEVWIACGTLLGWYRQCTVTPYTPDTDFATWAKYLLAGVAAARMDCLFQRAIDNLQIGERLRLYQRFGEPTATMEYSFAAFSDAAVVGERVDLFFTFRNASALVANSSPTDFLIPFHSTERQQVAYSIYPPFRLCSVALLGVKLLAPCEPETVIRAEYGSSWRRAIVEYDYIRSPLNSSPFQVYNFSEQQHFVF